MLRRKCKAVSATIKESHGFNIPWDIILQIVKWLIGEWCNRGDQFVEQSAHPSDSQLRMARRRARKVLRRQGFTGADLRMARNVVIDRLIAESESSTHAELTKCFAEALGEVEDTDE
jgi:hypothetical protein